MVVRCVVCRQVQSPSEQLVQPYGLQLAAVLTCETGTLNLTCEQCTLANKGDEQTSV